MTRDLVGRWQVPRTRLGHLYAVHRAEQVATPARNTISRIPDYWLSGLLVKAEDILGANRKTDATSGTDGLI
jgi:hypothetical protein